MLWKGAVQKGVHVQTLRDQKLVMYLERPSGFAEALWVDYLENVKYHDPKMLLVQHIEIKLVAEKC